MKRFGNVKHPPHRIAFVHLMRTGGTFVNAYLESALGDSYEIFDSWRLGFDRDWTKSELRALANASWRKRYVHNHVVNWDQDLVEMYKNSGFVTFTFIRDVGDQLCSLYGFVCANARNPVEMSLDRFIQRQLLGESIENLDYRHWSIPEFASQLTHIEVFGPEAVPHLVHQKWGLKRVDHESIDRNGSANRGYAHYCAIGKVSRETQRLLENSVFYERYLSLLDSVPHLAGNQTVGDQHKVA